ncbi:MAG: hypothetical protein ACT6T0_12140 [Nevskia sp.]|uniref:hypothetical protein n=1 Tax=Nevskia sp. TaxID=1929292 RepID=UPI004035A6EF
MELSAHGITAESLAVGVIVLAFALRALFQLFPGVSRRGLSRLRAVFGLAPPPAATTDCNSGCGSCNNCGSSAPTRRTADEVPISFQPKAPKR